jgi:hypothetical protein
MATGNYGTIRPADVGPNDVDIFYTYTPDRETPPTLPVQRLNANNILKPLLHPDEIQGNIPVLGGLYNLSLPAENFSSKGFYTIIIRPREIRLRITDCGVLSAYPNIKGLVFDKAVLPGELTANDALVGYRVEYYNDANNKIPNFFRIITSSNSAEPVSQNLQNTVQKAIRYRFNDTASLMYTTLTPSTASNVAPNRAPFIGEPNQLVVLTNTFFNPITIEVEMVDHDFDTLAHGIFGNQIKSIVDGKYTIYDTGNNIYKQYNLYEIQDQFTGEPLHEVKEEVTEIDFSKNFDDITDTTNN